MSTTVSTRDGLALYARHWPRTPAVGTVLIVHGLGEHCGRHADLAAALNAHGWHVLGYDQRGHGHSPGRRGRLARNDDLLHDLAAVIDHARAARPGRLVLLGHSMGGVLAARFAAGALEGPAPWHRELEGLVLSSPALRIGMNGLQKALLAVLGSLAPDAAVGNGLHPEWISRDPAVVQAYRGDDLVHDRISPRLLRFMLDAGERVRAAAPAWRLPTLLMWAGSDRCVDPAGSADFAAAAPGRLVSAHAFPPLFHEIFHEPERAGVMQPLRDWLDALPKARPG